MVRVGLHEVRGKVHMLVEQLSGDTLVNKAIIQ